MEIVPSSPKAVVVETNKIDLPLEDLKVGFSGKVALNYCAEGALRTYVSRRANKLGFKLRVLKHSDCYEVARIA